MFKHSLTMTAITSATPDELSGKSTRLVILGSGVQAPSEAANFSMIIGARHVLFSCPSHLGHVSKQSVPCEVKKLRRVN